MGNDEQRVIVVGAGLAGLAAAAFAARAGAAVTVFEARHEAGGRARTTRVEHGYRFNQGPHALYAANAGRSVLAALGIEPRGTRPPARGYGRYRGRLALLPGTPTDAVRSHLIDVRAKLELGRLLVRPARLARTELAGRSLADWTAEHVHHEGARDLVHMLGRVATYTDAADGIAADAAIPQMVGALTEGVLYLDGGWQQLVDALAGRLAVAGTGWHHAKVSAVRRDGDGLVVLADGAAHGADSVVLAAGGPQHADDLLGGTSVHLQVAASEAQPVYATTIELALSHLPIASRRVVFGVDEPLYLSTHTPSADLGGDDGHSGEVVHVMRYGPDDGSSITVLEAFLDDVQPGWRAAVVARRNGRAQVVAHDRPRPARGYGGRAPVALADVKGVFLAGDWVGPVGLLADASLASGAAAGRAAARPRHTVPAAS